MALLTFSLCVGALIGLKHHILMLIPTTVGMSTVCYVVSLLEATGGYGILSAIGGSTIALQGGYMIGLASRDRLDQSLDSPVRSGSDPRPDQGGFPR